MKIRFLLAGIFFVASTYVHAQRTLIHCGKLIDAINDSASIEYGTYVDDEAKTGVKSLNT